MKTSRSAFSALAMFFVACAPLGASAQSDDFHDRQPNGPAFDCTAAHRTHVERTICADPALALLDARLGDAYGRYLFETGGMRAASVSEAAWLNRRDACATAECLRASYAGRIAALSALSDEIEATRDAKALRKPVAFRAPRALLAKLEKIAQAKCLDVIEPLDLGDGRTSYRAEGCPTCQPPELILFHPEGASYRIVFREESCYVSGLFDGLQSTRTNGLLDVATFSRGSAVDHGRALYAYDGHRYRMVASAYSHFYTEHHQVASFVPGRQ